MSQPTQTYKRSFSGSIGAGMGSIVNGKGRTYYVLEHKVSSKYHHAGEAQEIIVDQIELGRDAKCAVRFDESFKTVSRRHAAIVRDGQNWKLIQLSDTNTTFLNGRPIQNEWYLQNGDEIQLSVNGPKLGFLIPTGNKSTVGSIGLSRRLSLFRQQALRPYKTAMWILSVVLLLTISGGVGLSISQYKQIEKLNISHIELDEARKRAEADFARMQKENSESEKKLIETRKQLSSLDKQLKNLKVGSKDSTIVPRISSTTSNKNISACEPHTYFVWIRKIVVTYNGVTRELENVGTGTGFLLADGRFVTARHVVEPWMFPSDENDKQSLTLNAIMNAGGTVTCYLEAYSPSGKKLTFVSKDAIINHSSDEQHTYEGITISLPKNYALDWAYFKTTESSGLSHDNKLSQQLPLQAKLTILGYPMGIGANSPTDIHPIYSEAVVAREGLEQGYILTTATTFEHGNSGGPVFATSTDGNLIVVGIVSSGAGRSTGMVVPINAVRE